jgi:uncharacterized membrane protein
MSDVSVVRQLRTARRALWWILGLSVTGVLFSGTLSYRELCLAGAAGCSVAQGGRLLGVPVCVYGLVMYLLVAVVAALGLRPGVAASTERSMAESGSRPRPA